MIIFPRSTHQHKDLLRFFVVGSLTHFGTRTNSGVTHGMCYLVQWLRGTRREIDSSLNGILMSGYVFRGGNDHANIQFRMKDEEE